MAHGRDGWAEGESAMRNEEIIWWKSLRTPLGTENIVPDRQQHSGCLSHPQWNGKPVQRPSANHSYSHHLSSQSQFSPGQNDPLKTVQFPCYLKGCEETASIPTNIPLHHCMHSTQLNLPNEKQGYSYAASHPIIPSYSPPMTDLTSAHLQNPNSHRDAEAQRWRIIQYHLRLLLHAQYCRQRRLERSIHCNNPHCRIMQNVLRHSEECTAERSCPMQHCFSSRRIIKHWKNCISAECPLCGDLLRERQRGGLPSWRQ
ncbi:hypothetical protein TSMEX_002979 [Taenia solium]|eukprot:TsM_001200600 transcript=TsM_001200600 gene=TsM_001200600